jgi:hypothetical protein
MKTKHFLVTLSILGSLLMVAPNALASTSSVCNAVFCDNPQPNSIFNQNPDRPLDRTPAPSLGPVCSVFTDWKVAVVIAIVADRLNVSYIYTLVPTLICR